MGFLKWLGRVVLWILLLPVGIWRSFRHGRKKSEKKILKAIEGRGGGGSR